jgi:hypothetical protein
MPNLTHFTSGNRYPALLLLLLPFLITACFNPEPEDYGLALEAVDVVCVEATFRVTASGVPETWSCGLYRDDSLVVTETLSGQSGYIRDTGLLPAADYTYHISYMKDGRDKDRSDPVAVTTLDTTSHDFTWTVETLGDAGSYLNDVAIVDENNIWAVGYIKEGDSIYNAAHWDGEKWDMVLVGSVGVTINGIYYISDDNIWLTTGIIYHWNGSEWERYHLWDMGIIHYPEDGGVYQVWGSSSDNVWFAGNNGSLVHYDGSRFRRVESGTDVDFTDIYGVNANHIWVAGCDEFTQSVIIGIFDSKPTKLFHRYSDGTNNLDDETYWSPEAWTIWTGPHSRRLKIAGGYGLYELDNRESPQKYTRIDVEAHTGYFAYPWKMRGNHEADLFIAGEFGSLFHFNGLSWHWYEGLVSESVRLKSIAVINRSVVAVGVDHGSFLSKGVVVMGK